MKSINKARRDKRKKEGKVYGPHHAWISTLLCAVLNSECFGVVKGHHIRHVGNGGEDAANEVPLCVQHHSEVHTGGRKTFEQKYGIHLKELAIAYWKESPNNDIENEPL